MDTGGVDAADILPDAVRAAGELHIDEIHSAALCGSLIQYHIAGGGKQSFPSFFLAAQRKEERGVS